MCCNRMDQIIHNKIDRLHELSLRLVYNGKTSDFSELLEKDGSFTTKISDNFKLKCSRYQKDYVLKMRKECLNLDMKYLTI